MSGWKFEEGQVNPRGFKSYLNRRGPDKLSDEERELIERAMKERRAKSTSAGDDNESVQISTEE